VGVEAWFLLDADDIRRGEGGTDWNYCCLFPFTFCTSCFLPLILAGQRLRFSSGPAETLYGKRAGCH
jgi:hypothetical protein